MSHTARPFSHRAGAACATAVAAVACNLVTATPAAAELTIKLPAGEACRDFAVDVVIGDDSKRNTRQFTDRNGNQVSLITGRAESVVVKAESGASVTVPSRGAVTRTTTDANGVSTVEHRGHLLLVLFSTDVGGAGLTPTSTTLITGRTVFTVTPDGVFTVQSVSGRTTDLCDVLAS